MLPEPAGRFEILGVLPKPLTQLLQEENPKMKEFYRKLGNSGAPLQEQAAAKPFWQRDVNSHKGLGPKNHPRCCGNYFVVFIKSLFMNTWSHGRNVRDRTQDQSRSFRKWVKREILHPGLCLGRKLGWQRGQEGQRVELFS